VRVRLFFDDQEVLAQDESLPRIEGNEVKLETRAPARAGEVKVTLKVQELPGEVTVANNEISTYLTVTKEGVSVLLVDKERSGNRSSCSSAARRPTDSPVGRAAARQPTARPEATRPVSLSAGAL
jgi:hypothetical protein